MYHNQYEHDTEINILTIKTCISNIAMHAVDNKMSSHVHLNYNKL
jgi:hypothetical protein